MLLGASHGTPRTRGMYLVENSFLINDYFTTASMKTIILGTSAGPTHRQMEETIRGVIGATVIRENNPRCQLNVTI